MRLDGFLSDVSVLNSRCAKQIDGYLYDGNTEYRLYPARLDRVIIPSGGPAFPTQFFGFRIWKSGLMLDLCLVNEADAPIAMGGVWKLRADGITRAAYLVETSDGNASPLRIQTSTGIKSVRLKT